LHCFSLWRLQINPRPGRLRSSLKPERKYIPFLRHHRQLWCLFWFWQPNQLWTGTKKEHWIFRLGEMFNALHSMSKWRKKPSWEQDGL
jgi:hypothetical protein